MSVDKTKNNAMLIASHRAILARPLQRELGTDKPMQLTARDLVKVLVREYETQYCEILPLNRRHATAYMRRALTWCGNDATEVEKLIQFVIKSWDDICDVMRLSGRPSIRLFGSADIFQRLHSLYKDGFKKAAIKNRFDKDDVSPSEGW